MKKIPEQDFSSIHDFLCTVVFSMVMVLAQGPALGVRRRGEEASETFYYQFCSEQAVRFEIHFSSSLQLLHVIDP